jgi:hypothetical protein
MFAFTWESSLLKVTVVLEAKAPQLRKLFKFSPLAFRARRAQTCAEDREGEPNDLATGLVIRQMLDQIKLGSREKRRLFLVKTRRTWILTTVGADGDRQRCRLPTQARIH